VNVYEKELLVTRQEAKQLDQISEVDRESVEALEEINDALKEKLRLREQGHNTTSLSLTSDLNILLVSLLVLTFLPVTCTCTDGNEEEISMLETEKRAFLIEAESLQSSLRRLGNENGQLKVPSDLNLDLELELDLDPKAALEAQESERTSQSKLIKEQLKELSEREEEIFSLKSEYQDLEGSMKDENEALEDLTLTLIG